MSAVTGERGLKPIYTPKELLQFVPDVYNYCNFTFATVAYQDSTNIHPDDWVKMTCEIEASCKAGIGGVIIIHGTDTMAYTASMLSFMIKNPPFPIVLTGSQLPLELPDSDGKKNLLNAVQFAVFGIPGIFIIFDGKVIRGVRASKVNTTSFHAFESINAPPVAEFENKDYLGPPPQTIPINKIDWQTNYSGGETVFDVKIDTLVMSVTITPGFHPVWLRSFLDPEKFHGLIIEGFGTGNIPNRQPFNLLPEIKSLMNAGIPVLVQSVCPYGKVSMDLYEVGRDALDIGIIPGGGLTKEAALTKMMWTLGHSRDPEEVKKIMLTNIAGEI